MEKQKEMTRVHMGIRARMILLLGGGVTVIFILSSLLNLFGVPFAGISGNYQDYRSETVLKMNDLADMKKEEIQYWFSDRINHIKVFSKTVRADAIVDRFANGMARKEDKDVLFAEIRNLQEYRNLFMRTQEIIKRYADYSEVQIIDIQTGMVIFSTNENNTRTDLADHQGIINAKMPGINEQVCFFKDKAGENVNLYIIYPYEYRRISENKKMPSSVIMFIINPEKLLTPMLHTSMGLGRSGEIILVNMNRIILSPLKYPIPENRMAEPLKYRLATKPAELAAWGIDGTVFSKDYRGIPVIAAVRHMRITSEFGIGLIVKINEEEVFAFARKSMMRYLLISGMGLLFLLWLVFLISGRIVHPVIRLSMTAEKITAGDLSIRAAVETKDEVGLLADAFNKMVEKIQKWHKKLEIMVRERTALLSESEERLRLSTELANVAVWEYSFITNTMSRSNNHDQLYGIQRQTTWDINTFLNATHPDDREVSNEIIQKSVAPGGPDQYTFDFRVVYPDLSIHWLMVTGQVVERNSEGQGTIVRGCLIDITERKQAEEELELVNEELMAVNRIISTTTTTTGVQGILESVLDEALAVTGLEGGTICLVTPDDTLHLSAHRATSEATIQDLTTNIVKIGDCLCGECARDRKPLILADRAAVLKFTTREATRGEDFRFHAAFPLLSGEKCLGVLCVFTRTDKKPSERSLKLIETVSSQIAMALENAQLYEQTLSHTGTLEAKVKDRTEALEKNQRALVNVVEDLNEKTEALEAANVRLQELDRLKNIFLASMSHELRTPLNSIIGFTGILLMGLTGKLNPEQKNQLGMVKSSAHHLLGLINDVLDISKVEAGMMEPFPEEFSLNEVIQEATAGVSVAAAEKGVTLVREVPEGIMLFSDRKRFMQILMNLLSNAVKFTERGSVRVSAHVTRDERRETKDVVASVVLESEANDRPSSVVMTVADTGIGIKPEDMNRLFFPFQQVDASLTKKFEGTGLGLYLSKKLANLLGGDITVKSEYGKGSEFVVELPVRIEE